MPFEPAAFKVWHWAQLAAKTFLPSADTTASVFVPVVSGSVGALVETLSAELTVEELVLLEPHATSAALTAQIERTQISLVATGCSLRGCAA